MAEFCVRVVPNASRAAVVGRMADGVLKVKVCAPPEGGRANDAVVELLADIFGVPRRAVSILSGQSSRNKRVGIEGLDEQTLNARLHF